KTFRPFPKLPDLIHYPQNIIFPGVLTFSEIVQIKPKYGIKSGAVYNAGGSCSILPKLKKYLFVNGSGQYKAHIIICMFPDKIYSTRRCHFHFRSKFSTKRSFGFIIFDDFQIVKFKELLFCKDNKCNLYINFITH